MINKTEFDLFKMYENSDKKDHIVKICDGTEVLQSINFAVRLGKIRKIF